MGIGGSTNKEGIFIKGEGRSMSSSAGGNPLEHLPYEVHILIPEIENKEGIRP